MFKSLPANAAIIIMTSLMFAYTQDIAMPGSFQQAVDEMFTLNNLPKVKFPAKVNSSGVLGATANMMNGQANNNNQKDENMEHEEGTNKRSREETPTKTATAKIKKINEANEHQNQREPIESIGSEEEYQPRPPAPAHHQHYHQAEPEEEHQCPPTDISFVNIVNMR